MVVRDTKLRRRSVKEALRALRLVAPLNHLSTSMLRALSPANAPDFLVSHLPRVGEVTLELPDDRRIKLWSAADDWITSRVWWLGLAGYESETVAPFLRFAATATVVLDIGAYTGYYSLVAGAMNPDARIYAFEAHAFLAARIGRNVSLNPGLEVTVLPYAVCEARGPVDFHLGAAGLPSSSSLAEDWEGRYVTRRVAGLDIDSFCREWAVEGVDLVKMDVESREPEVFSGMRQTIERDRPVVFSEVFATHRARYAETEAWLAERGYRFFALRPDGPAPTSSFASDYGDGPTAENYLMCPEEKVPAWLGSPLGTPSPGRHVGRGTGVVPDSD